MDRRVRRGIWHGAELPRPTCEAHKPALAAGSSARVPTVMQRWLLLAMVSAPPVSTASPEAPHPALGALSMGGDLYGRMQARASAAAQKRNGGGGAPASDQCDPSAVTMTAVAADESKPIVVNSTVYAQWAWSSTAAARAPPLTTDWVGLYCARSQASLHSMSNTMIKEWNVFNTTYKKAGVQPGSLVGRVDFSIPAWNAWGWGGTCEFRYFTHRDGTSYCLASTQATPFVVAGMSNEDAAMAVSLAADRTSVKVGETLNIQYSWKMAGTAAAEKDWVGIYCASDVVALQDVPNNAICAVGCTSLWAYVGADPHWSGTKGSIPLKIPPSRYGVCEARYFNRADGSAYDHQGTSSKVFTISNAGVQWGAVELRVSSSHPGVPGLSSSSSAGGGQSIALGAGFDMSWMFRDLTKAPAAADVIAFYCGDDTAGSADNEPFGGFGLAATPDSRYLDYALASTLDGKKWQTGSGNFSRVLGSTARLPLCEFRMFRAESGDGAQVGAWNGPSSSLAWLGSSVPFEVGGHDGPQQLHLALTGRPDEMRVHWTSGSALRGSVKWWLLPATDAAVESGASGGGVIRGSGIRNSRRSSSANGTPSSSPGAPPTGTAAGSVPHTYTAADMCNSPANDPHTFHDPGMLHEAVMTSLQPGSTYVYSVGDDQTGWSPQRSFLASLPAVPKRGAPGGSEFEPFTYIVYADMGVGVPGRWSQCPDTFGESPGCSGGVDPWAHEVGVLVAHEVNSKFGTKQAVRMIHHIGDISYAVGNSPTWEAFFALIQPIARHTPYMVGIGNHEMCHSGGGSRDPSAPGDAAAVDAAGVGYCAGTHGDDSGGECGVPMNARFTMPANGNAVWWYSFDFSAVKTIMLSSEHDLHPGSVQYKWLVTQLSKVDREVTPWVVVELHRPMYNNENYGADYATGTRIRSQLEALLLAHRVDLVLAGHYHSYMRTTRIANDSAVHQQPGIYHFTIGSAGGILDTAGMVASEKDWQLHFEETFGYGRITVANRTHMLWEFIRTSDSNVSAATPTPFVGDSVWIIKPGAE
jgi:hypothetical protein